MTNKDYNNYNNFPGIGSSACMVGPLSTPTLTSFYVKLVATVVAIARAAVSCAVTINGDIRLQYRPTDISVCSQHGHDAPLQTSRRIFYVRELLPSTSRYDRYTDSVLVNVVQYIR